MKKILCYGDSNTYGYNPYDGSRFDENIRWTGLIKKKFEGIAEVIEEGANNRTGFVNNPAGFMFSAQRHFPKTISKIKDLDVLVLAIGINDLQFQFDINFKTIEKGLETLILEGKKYAKNIILVLPAQLNEDILKGGFRVQFDETSISKSKKVGREYRKLANVYGCTIFDINDFAHPSPVDGLHYDERGHELIAENLYNLLNKLL